MTDGFDDPELYRVMLGIAVVVASLAAIAVMLWPMDERLRFRWWRR